MIMAYEVIICMSGCHPVYFYFLRSTIPNTKPKGLKKITMNRDRILVDSTFFKLFSTDCPLAVSEFSNYYPVLNNELIRNEINCLQHVNTQRELYLLYLGAPCHPFVERAPQWTYRRFSVL